MAEVVLDASAVLCLLQAEPGADEVARALPGATIGAVNLSEVVAKLADAGMPPEAARRALSGLGLVVVTFDEALAHATGELRTATRAEGLSLGDRACLALARSRRLPAWTTDGAWAGVAIGVEIRVLGGRRRKPSVRGES